MASNYSIVNSNYLNQSEPKNMKIVCLRSLYSVGLKKRKRKEKNTLIIIEFIEFYKP